MRLLAQLLSLAGFLALGRGQFNPCSGSIYNELNEPHRSTGYETGYPEKPICDIHLPEGWYRFTSKAGGEMPTTCPDRLKCGTVVPIWMKGTHPTVADDIVMREACGNFNSGSGAANPCCEHKVDIAVKNCSGFYVYYLSPPPSCPVAYCAGDIPPCPLGKWSPTGFAPCKDAHPQLKTRPTLTGPIILNNKSFEFHCDINWPQMDPDQRFQVVWTFEGKEDPAVLPQVLQDPDRTAILDGTLLRGHLNTNVGCQVRAFYDGNQAQMSGTLKSNTFYAGVTMNPAKLVVSEKAFEEEISISSTVPILCDHNTECCITFKLDVDATTGQPLSY
ncbi:von Willebrand factor D and EGF domain-containing protein-like [Elysia marginata]|uniref:von Willebrand factor D and EGF domain-containing protein-like n=1 Tax=Elysia marginata TaxID=1093978 RepID=A0AAV4EF36_9GAST|nr:von Willebrand factor D and EGF domain-containing protein-like [Elysia marginata]